MKLLEVSIKNFKSIVDLELKFSDNIYCLVGQNEVGKSNILKALEQLGRDKPVNVQYHDSDNGTEPFKIEGLFSLDHSEKAFIRNLKGSTDTASTSYASSVISHLKVVVDSQTTEKSFSISSPENGVDISLDELRTPDAQMKLKEFLNSQLPIIEYFEKEDFLINPFDPKEYLKQGINQRDSSFIKLLILGGIKDIASLENQSAQQVILLRERTSDNLNKLLKSYYHDLDGLKVQIDSHDGVFSLFFRDNFGRITQFEERSTGFQYFFSFLVNKLYANKMNSSNSIFLLDEPALSLHPTNQKRFLKILESFSKDNIVIYTTHSPFSIFRLNPTRTWVVERTPSKGTYINPKPYQHNWRTLRSSLGIDISDSFFYADKSLLVEGPEDRIYIGILLNYFTAKGMLTINSDLLSIIDSGSINNMPAMIQILLDESRPMVVLIDDDDERTYNRLKKKEESVNSKKKLSIIKISDIDKACISIEDLVPQQSYLMAVENYVKLLVKENVIKHKAGKEKFELPKIEDTKKRYSQIAKALIDTFVGYDDKELDKKTPISKLGIAHEFEKLVNINGLLADETEEQKCLLLMTKVLGELGLLMSK